MAKSLPYFPFYPKDFLADNDVEQMPTAAVGAYVLLMCRSWQETPPGSLPNDESLLRVWSKLSRRLFEVCKPHLRKVFKLGPDGRLHQKRLQIEHSKILNRSEVRSNAGRKGAIMRWQTYSKRDGKRIASYNQNQSQSNTPLPPKGGKCGGKSKKAGWPKAQVDAIYDAYPRKAARPSAIRAIGNALTRLSKEHADPVAWLLARTRQYAELRPKQISFRDRDDTSKTPYPATWFNGERYAPDDACWESPGYVEKKSGQKAYLPWGPKMEKNLQGETLALKRQVAAGHRPAEYATEAYVFRTIYQDRYKPTLQDRQRAQQALARQSSLSDATGTAQILPSALSPHSVSVETHQTPDGPVNDSDGVFQNDSQVGNIPHSDSPSTSDNQEVPQ